MRARGSSITGLERIGLGPRAVGLAVGLQVDVGLSGMLKPDGFLVVFPRLLLRTLSLLIKHNNDF